MNNITHCDPAEGFCTECRRAAANKAAEEGELQDEGFLYGYFRKNGKHFDMLKGRPNVHTLSSGWVPLYTTKEAADRASRQVANKAEVEPLVRQIHKAVLQLKPNPALTKKEKYEVLGAIHCCAGIVSQFATPPATTDASTARDQALEEAARVVLSRCIGFAHDDADLHEQAAAIRALKGSVGASTVLTDERIAPYSLPENERLSSAKVRAIADSITPGDGWGGDDWEFVFANAVADYVAAQAGQVAVIGLSEEQTDRIARNYFSEQWAVQHAKDAIHDALIEASAVGEAAVPEGFAIVPVKPTPKMVDATFNHSQEKFGSVESHNTRNKRIYAAMIAAAPSPAKESK